MQRVNLIYLWPYGEIGKHTGLKIRALRVQVPLRPNFIIYYFKNNKKIITTKTFKIIKKKARGCSLIDKMLAFKASVVGLNPAIPEKPR